MAEPLGRGPFADPLRPARVFAPLFTLAAIGFLLATVVVGYTAVVHERVVVARAQDGSLSLPSGPRETLTLYGASTTGADPPAVECQLDSTSSQIGLVFSSTGSTFDLEGRTLYRLGTVDSGWSAGDVVTCTGAEQFVAVSGSRVEKVLITGMCAAVAGGAWLLSRLGYRSRRSVDQRPERAA